MTPTQNAQAEFKRAVSNVIQVSGSGSVVAPIMPILINVVQGLDHMAVAQRAIYIKLEAIEKDLKRQAAQKSKFVSPF